MPETVDKLATEMGVSPLVARLLINRGVNSAEQAHSFLFDSLKDLPNPFLFKDMNRAVDRIIQAIHTKEGIVIYGDYDVDGTTSTSLLLLFFQDLGFPVRFYIPHRMKEGYSLNSEALKRLKQEGASVVITVDNGIAAQKEAEVARELGIDLIITDHHEVPPHLPSAYAVINPLQEECAYPAKVICGCGVAFNLALALRQKLREQGYFATRPEPNMKKYLDLVALATVADVVPLTGINRVFVRVGLQEMEHTSRPGLQALKEVAGVESVKASDLGFRLGPRVNACGRLYDASTGVRLLTSSRVEEARLLAKELDAANRERQVLEEKILHAALAQVATDPLSQTRWSHVLYHQDWHPGVVGIVASRLVSRLHRPVIVLGQDGDSIKGSARSYGGLNLVQALRNCSSLLLRCGGHKAAAGLTLQPQNFDAFKKAFEEEVASSLSADDCIPRLEIDDWLDPSAINLKLLQDISQLAPFGQGNREPLFALRGILPLYPKIVGEKHLKFNVTTRDNTLSAMAFGMADFWPLPSSVNLAFACELNTYQGRNTVQLNIKDIKNSHPRECEDPGISNS